VSRRRVFGSRIRLVGVFISFEKNFYRLPFTPPLSGSPYRSFSSPMWIRLRGQLLHGSMQADGMTKLYWLGGSDPVDPVWPTTWLAHMSCTTKARHYTWPCLDVRKFCFFNVSHIVAHFVCLWQILSYHGLTRLKRFVSRRTSKRCN
jgi:hypothetical protein